MSHYFLTDSLRRRAFLGRMSTGLFGIGLADLIARSDSSLPERRHTAKAKRVLQIFCPGAASHIDLWDYKPELIKRHGQPLPGEEDMVSFQGKNGNLMRSPWDFRRYGQSGKHLSCLLPQLGEFADDMAFIHSMHSKSNTHGPGCLFMNTGFVQEGFPSAGSWMSHALGSENDNLPTYVAIPDVRGEPPNGKANWNSGFLPAQHQGISINAAHPGDSALTARMAAYELAARMQLAAPEVSDLSRESTSTHQAYGTDDSNALKAAYARNCLLTRRFLENGVRYVSLYCGSRASGVDGLMNWDAHKTLKSDYERHGPILDQPTATLIRDLKQRGLLEDTLVMWTTEFGRMPTHQAGTAGRDHNPDAFTTWLMGAGVKGGVSHGATDEFGRRSVVDKATVWDFYATVLHLLGLDHEAVTFYQNGIDRRLTDVHGHVIQSVLA
jgi:hypothetical protein